MIYIKTDDLLPYSDNFDSPYFGEIVLIYYEPILGMVLVSNAVGPLPVNMLKNAFLKTVVKGHMSRAYWRLVHAVH